MERTLEEIQREYRESMQNFSQTFTQAQDQTMNPGAGRWQTTYCQYEFTYISRFSCFHIHTAEIANFPVFKCQHWHYFVLKRTKIKYRYYFYNRHKLSIVDQNDIFF